VNGEGRTDLPKPAWIRSRLPHGPVCDRVRGILRRKGLHTVCEEALCPNRGECWGNGTATFLILGDICTRKCGFCAVKTGIPQPLSVDEAPRVADTVKTLGLTHVVVTSVTRDDLPDGGATAFAEVIAEIHSQASACTVEVLIPDFQGDDQALGRVVRARPEVLGHNLETVRRLCPEVRPRADYDRSLEVLRRAKLWNPGTVTKSGIMVGLGEEWEEILQVMEDLRGVGCDLLTVGQYLRPTKTRLPVVRYYEPETFDTIREEARKAGFRWVEAGPFVRSSYRAERALQHTRPHPVGSRGNTG
jgi:lipoyl synthase